MQNITQNNFKVVIQQNSKTKTQNSPSVSGDGVESWTTCTEDPKPDIIESVFLVTRRRFFFGGGSGVHCKKLNISKLFL